jgi:predicted RNase H-like nuclease
VTIEIIAGADGCRAGWVVARENVLHNSISWEVVPSLPHLFDRQDAPNILALDIPIGLPLIGPRACDLEARRMLGRGRSSSVFSAPIRAILAATSYAEANQAGDEAEGKRLSKQAWAIVPKIREVDEFLRGEPLDQDRVREVHPEVCFYFMAGCRSMGTAKKKAAGRAERAALLRTHFGNDVDSAFADRRRLGCHADDLLDALAALWTARRIHAGTAVTLPANPPRDSFGLRMEMVA